MQHSSTASTVLCKCSGCNAEDCGNCSNCKDMKRFGGPGTKKKACIHRNCLGHNKTGITTGMFCHHVHVCTQAQIMVGFFSDSVQNVQHEIKSTQKVCHMRVHYNA